MSRQLHFAWVLHNHQPVGNFAWVFEENYARAYEPTIAALERHPSVRVTLHYTGPLLEWLGAERPELLDRIAALVGRGQVELLTGGFYEPLLPLIPLADQLGQIERMNAFVRQRFGYDPTGLWLAERVWEPSLPVPLVCAGVEYTVVDDTHFLLAGLREGDCFGCYVTEDQGCAVKVFPIPRVMRESLPWRSVPDVHDLMWDMASDAAWPPRIAVMADDGEKFGAWPGTDDLVWRQGWMEQFLSMLEANAGWLTTTTLADFAHQFPAAGRVYLPSASYPEMMEWALPPARSAELAQLRQALSTAGRQDVLGYLAGASWRGFLAKYPESNHLHKKMLRVHQKVMAALPGANAERREQMQRELWMGQCNCPYWHGVFGGLYLADVRAANYRHLLRAENLADGLPAGHEPGEDDRSRAGYEAGACAEEEARAERAAGANGRARQRPRRPRLSVTRTDFDCDGEPELLVDGPLMNLYLDLQEGGAICEWDWRPGAVNLADTLARRPEPYHQRLIDAQTAVRPGERERPREHAWNEAHPDREPAAAPSSSWPGVRPGAAVAGDEQSDRDALLHYDWHRRTILLDHFLPEETTFEEFRTARYRDLGDFANQPYTDQVEEPGARRDAPLVVRLRREGHLWEGPIPQPTVVEKVLAISPTHAALSAQYVVTNASERPLRAHFAVETNWGLLGGGGNPAGAYQINGLYPSCAALDAAGQEDGVSELRLANTYLGVAARIESSERAALWRFPVETISNSEAGIERVYQCSCALLSWPLALGPGQEWRVRLDVTLEPASAHQPPEASTRYTA